MNDPLFVDYHDVKPDIGTFVSDLICNAKTKSISAFHSASLALMKIIL